MTRNQSGFTIIELIVVIALLGILSAVALPRFINVTSEAHDASVEGAGAGFATGIALLKAQVVANGDLGSFDNEVAGYGDAGVLSVNTKGYPVGISLGASAALPANAAACVDIWANILDANAPSAAVATANGVDYVAAFTTPSCVYTYRTKKDGADRLISYSASTGEVSVTIP